MTITQTVEVTNSRRLHLDFDIPREIPTGRAQVEVKVIPFPKKEEISNAPLNNSPNDPFKERRGLGCMKGKIRMAEDFDAPLEEDFNEPLKERVFGCAKGQFRMAEDFDAPLEDFKDYM